MADGDMIVVKYPALPPAPRFLRGDCNGDGTLLGLISEGVFLLNFNFLGGATPPCLAACDADGDGSVAGQVTDALHILNHAFLGGPPPAPPFPRCGSAVLASDAVLGCLEPPARCP
jgi:hypothetical protein